MAEKSDARKRTSERDVLFLYPFHFSSRFIRAMEASVSIPIGQTSTHDSAFEHPAAKCAA